MPERNDVDPAYLRCIKDLDRVDAYEIKRALKAGYGPDLINACFKYGIRSTDEIDSLGKRIFKHRIKGADEPDSLGKRILGEEVEEFCQTFGVALSDPEVRRHFVNYLRLRDNIVLHTPYYHLCAIDKLDSCYKNILERYRIPN